MTEPATNDGGPLAGYRVLELSTVIMGPFAGQMLGDLGADVIKVETEGGDMSRALGGGPHRELSGVALNLHRNKRSITIDLKSDAGRDVLLRLLENCDVFCTNLRPGPLRRLGLDWDSLSDRFPRLVHCQAQGFRSDSDESERPAYDDIIQALTGVPQLLDIAFGETRFMPSTFADKVAGMYIAQGVLAALLHRERTGRGQSVEVPWFDAVLAFNLVEHLGRAAVPGEPPGYGRVLTPHRGPHRTRDGYIAMIPYTDKQWQALFEAVGKAELLDSPTFADHRARHANADYVYSLLASIIVERTTEEWLTLCHELGVPASPVPPLQELVDDPRHHRGVLRSVEHPVVGEYRHVEPPIRFSAGVRAAHRPAPLRAEHTDQILDEAGYSEEEIADLVARGVVARREDEPSA